MRAAVVRAYGAVPEIEEFAEPTPADGQMLVEVVAGGLNPVDIRIASGTFYGGAPPLPYVAGMEGIGRGADGLLRYFDVAAWPYGAFAQRAPIDSARAIELTGDVDPALAVSCGVAGIAAWLSLDWRARLREGETVLVLGASGVVGQIAVQAARLLGAGRVVAAARDPQALLRATERGADAVVTLDSGEDLTARLREACGDGADVVIDPVWGEPAAAALEACRPGGRLVQLGQSAGTHSNIQSAALRGRTLSILGYTSITAPAEAKRAAFERMIAHMAAGELTVDVETVKLDDIANAWQRQQSAPHVKLVLIP